MHRPSTKFKQLQKSGPEAPSFQKLLQTLPSVFTKDGFGIERQYYVIEGDVLANFQQVYSWISERSDSSPANKITNSELIVLEKGGKKIFWAADKRALTYDVDPSTFRSKEDYDQVTKNFEQAARDWEGACSHCRLSIRRVSAQQVISPLFKIVFTESSFDFVAASFFPNDPTDKQVVWVTPQYFTSSFDRVGIFRHEIGHILGYRHTHIVGVPGCAHEDGGWIPLTSDGGRDKVSVMHYFCGGEGTREMQISETDRLGHQNLYGP